MRDIGYHFPDTAGEYKNIDSKVLLKKTVTLIRDKGYEIGNIDATICAERPKLKAHIPRMQQIMAQVMGIEEEDISLKLQQRKNSDLPAAKKEYPPMQGAYQ